MYYPTICNGAVLLSFGGKKKEMKEEMEKKKRDKVSLFEYGVKLQAMSQKNV